MNDTNKIAAEAEKEIEQHFRVTGTKSIILAAIEKATQHLENKLQKERLENGAVFERLSKKLSAAHASEHKAGAWPYCDCEICKPRAAHASKALPLQHDDRAAAIVRREELIGAIVGDLVRETNIFPNQVERAKQILRKRLSVKKKVMNAGLKR